MKRRVAGVTVMLLLVGAAALIWFNAADATPWDEAELRGDVVRLHYVGGQYDHHRDVRIDEGGEQVTLTITTRSFSMICSDVGVPRSIDAHLDAPLGERRLVDGARGT